jgi:hypothetical protein
VLAWSQIVQFGKPTGMTGGLLVTLLLVFTSSGVPTEFTSRRIGRIRKICNFSSVGSGVQMNIDNVGVSVDFIL